MCLAATCEVTVSHHRAEGLGLGLLQASSLGNPVIATGLVGTVDFPTPDTTGLVGYDLVLWRGGSRGADASLHVRAVRAGHAD
jgi:hypothetical protein